MVQTRRYSLGIISVACFGCVFSTCTYPWLAGPWTDTLGRTSITFSTSNMTGYDLTYRGSSASTWSCLFKNGSLILSRSSSINVAGDDYYLYACMLVNDVSSTKFYYHLMSNVDPSITKSGISLRIYPRATSLTVTDMCTICVQNPTSISLTVTNYTVMASDGTTTVAGSITSPAFAANPCDPTTTQAPTTTSTTTQGAVTQPLTQKPDNATSTSSAESSTNVAAIAGGTVGGIAALTGIFAVIGVKKKKQLCFKSGAAGPGEI